MAERLRARPWLFAALLAVALLIANILVEPNFGKPGNWPEELATLAPFAIVAMASTPSILSGGGGLDISIGPLAILANVILVEWLLPHPGLRTAWLAIPILMLIGGLIGAVNGTLVAVLRYQPVIATLCTLFVLTGVVTKIAPTPAIAPHVGWLAALGNKVGPIPGALILIAIPLALWFALSRTAFHRNLYAVGGNDVTAFSSGANVTVTRIVAYSLGGMFAAVAGIALTALLQTTDAADVTEYVLVALAAVALGGTQLGGGRGGLIASLLGACCIYLLQALISAAGVSSSWLTFCYGGLLVVGVVVGAKVLAPRRVGVRA